MMKRIFSIAFAAALMVTLHQPINATIIINEFMALNTSTYPDMCDYDDFSDWIELYNPADSAVDLKGYYLTDNFNIPAKWAFPEGATIAAKGFLIIRADGIDSKPGVVDTLDSYMWNVPFTTKRYHASFKLADEGDEIGLSKAAGSTTSLVDHVVFANQLADVSSGRNPSDNKWYKYDQPTPGAANTTDGKSTEFSSGSASFSIPAGFYDADQTVTMIAPAGEIYYTADGSIPFKTSTKYTGPVTIDKNTVLRARCIESDKLAGKVTTATYFIKDSPRDLMMISITADTTFLYDSTIGVFAKSYKGREVPIAMEFFNTDGKLVSKVNAGMTLGSMTNFTLAQKPMQIALKGGKYGDDFIWYQLFSKQISCFPRLRLRQGGDAWSTNLIADGILESMCKGQLELGIQAYRPIVVFINGRYYGIHDLREQFDDQYFTNNYNVDPTTKEEVRSTFLPVPGENVEGWELVSGSRDGYDDLLALAWSGDMTDELYNKIKERININSFVDFFCTTVFGKQISWGHNQDLWRVNTTKWQWLLTDFDRALVYEELGAKIDFNNFTSQAGVSGSIMAQDSLFPKLMKNAGFRHYFTGRFAAHLNSTFEQDRMMAIVDSLANMIRPEMKEYIEKWHNADKAIKSTDVWETEIGNVLKFCKERGKHIFTFFSTEPFNYSGTAALTVKLSKENGGDIHVNGVRMCSGLESLTFVKDCPMEVKAVAKPGFVFAGWNDGTSIDPLMVTLSGDSAITAKFEVSELHVVPTVISKDTTLNLTDNPYVSSGDILVDTGATLTIEKGVTLLMAQDADILVKGRLLINGTGDDTVIIRENSAAGAKNWGALNFENAKKTNTLTWLKVSGTTLGDDPLNQRGGINGNGSNVVIDHLTMSNIIYPLYFEYGSTTLKNSSITIDHICNGGIHIGRGAGYVEDNFWQSTGVTINTDAIDIKGVENGTVRGNRIYNFNGFNSDAIDLGEAAKSILIKDNIIYGSNDKGISVGGKSTASIVNNLVIGCDLGIGIKDEFSYADIDHNTFVRNRIGVAVYAKAYGRGGGTAKVTNCILAASKAGSIFKDQYSSIEIHHCLSDVDYLPGATNILNEPLFVNMLKNNFQLMAQSPCINAGDPAFRKDADGTATDIGAQYTFDTTDFPLNLAPHVAPPVIVINELMYNHDKKSPSGDWIELFNPTDEEIDLADWKLTDEGDYKNWLTNIDITVLDSEGIFFFPSGTKLPKGGYLVICADTAQFNEAYPNAGGRRMGNLPFGLNDTQTVLLYNNADALVNAVGFSNKSPWPTAPDGGGPSLELIHASGLNYHPLNWHASKGFGTPGTVNSASPVVRPAKVAAPLAYLLAQNFPNPCKSATTIQFALPGEDHVKISIYSLAGRLLETVINDKFDAGTHKVRWNAKKYSAGVYFYRIQAGRFVATKKLTIQ